ncbi:universal stress protein [Collinsella tanakaei]|uniref:universal stress protein n=1 Tax=Collinsella tanakaei TaxID=626935 RepID=UPI00195753BA|nr:universal stress protein [Collinsella tanakaei]MBM6778387.1 universal stress protein [Collinsella tanakaei]
MFFKNVMVPYDESEHAMSALHIALGMVGDDPAAEVHVVMIVAAGAIPTPSLMGGAFEDPFDNGTMMDYDNMMGAVIQRMRSDMERVVEDARDGAQCKITVTARLATSPVEGIAEYVADNSVDLVVMGRRGLGALRGMLGSVSFGVLRSVDVPVLTVK